MKTYKIGNAAKCIIRTCYGGQVGSEALVYDKQPYTVLNDVNVRLSFTSVNTNATSRFSELRHNEGNLSQIRISNVLLTNKILNLIFNKSEDLLCNTSQNFDSDDEKLIYFPSYDKIYQVFIYDNEGHLEAAYDSIDFEDSNAIQVDKANSNYIIFYAFKGNYGVSLNNKVNQYLSLDIELKSNIDDETVKNWIHIEKCELQINKDLDLSNTTNTTDLIFNVINSGQDYMILE